MLAHQHEKREATKNAPKRVCNQPLSSEIRTQGMRNAVTLELIIEFAATLRCSKQSSANEKNSLTDVVYCFSSWAHIRGAAE